MILALALLFLVVASFVMRNLTSQTSDILFLLAVKNLKQSVENHKQNRATSDFVHEYLPKILEEVRKR